jgi:hypothetical protein
MEQWARDEHVQPTALSSEAASTTYLQCVLCRLCLVFCPQSRLSKDSRSTPTAVDPAECMTRGCASTVWHDTRHDDRMRHSDSGPKFASAGAEAILGVSACTPLTEGRYTQDRDRLEACDAALRGFVSNFDYRLGFYSHQISLSHCLTKFSFRFQPIKNLPSGFCFVSHSRELIS